MSDIRFQHDNPFWPDEPFHNFRTSRSGGDWRISCSPGTSCDGFWSSNILKRVRLSKFQSSKLRWWTLLSFMKVLDCQRVGGYFTMTTYIRLSVIKVRRSSPVLKLSSKSRSHVTIRKFEKKKKKKLVLWIRIIYQIKIPISINVSRRLANLPILVHFAMIVRQL